MTLVSTVSREPLVLTSYVKRASTREGASTETLEAEGMFPVPLLILIAKGRKNRVSENLG